MFFLFQGELSATVKSNGLQLTYTLQLALPFYVALQFCFLSIKKIVHEAISYKLKCISLLDWIVFLIIGFVPRLVLQGVILTLPRIHFVPRFVLQVNSILVSYTLLLFFFLQIFSIC